MGHGDLYLKLVQYFINNKIINMTEVDYVVF